MGSEMKGMLNMIDQAEKLRRIVNNLNKNLPKADVKNITVQDKEKASNNNVLILEEKNDGGNGQIGLLNISTPSDINNLATGNLVVEVNLHTEVVKQMQYQSETQQETDKQANIKNGSPTDNQADKQVDMQIDKQVGTPNETQTNKQINTKGEMDTLNSAQMKPANTPAAHKAKVITITSGKGGVGKTSITANLALSLSQKGYRVVIVDADLGLSNIDVVFGIVPRYSLLELIKNEKGILDILCDGPNNIKFLSGGSGVKELVNLDQNSLDSFIANMSLLDHIADFILIDTGAGLSDTVLNFVLSADEVVLIITPEPTSITDAYALVKTVSSVKKNCSLKVLINRAESENEAKSVFNNFSMVADRFLGMKLESLGHLPFDQLFTKSVKLQKPYLISFPKNSTSKLIAEIAEQLISKSDDNENSQSGIKAFINRFVGLFSN